MGRPNVITAVLIRGRQESQSGREDVGTEQRSEKREVYGFDDGGRDHKPRNVGSL